MVKTASHGEARKSLENEHGTKSEESSIEGPVPDGRISTSIDGGWIINRILRCGRDEAEIGNNLPVEDVVTKTHLDHVSKVEEEHMSSTGASLLTGVARPEEHVGGGNDVSAYKRPITKHGSEGSPGRDVAKGVHEREDAGEPGESEPEVEGEALVGVPDSVKEPAPEEACHCLNGQSEPKNHPRGGIGRSNLVSGKRTRRSFTWFARLSCGSSSLSALVLTNREETGSCDEKC